MKLRNVLQQQEQWLAQQWLERTIDSYPAEGARFLAKQKDRFANPVGHALRTGTATVLARWLAGAAAKELAEALEPMVRVRSVQSLTPGQAVGFVLLLKPILRQALGRAGGDPASAEELFELDAEVDRLGLIAFDVYSQCRAEMYELRVAEVKRRVSGLLRRVGWGDDGPPDAAVPSAEAASTAPDSEGEAADAARDSAGRDAAD